MWQIEKGKKYIEYVAAGKWKGCLLESLFFVLSGIGDFIRYINLARLFKKSLKMLSDTVFTGFG